MRGNGRNRVADSRGAVSPFMMGLLAGMAIFSVMSLQWAQKEMLAEQEKNAAREKAKTEELKKGLEFSVLTETADNYHEDMTLDRALSQAATTGKTRGGADVLVVNRDQGQDKFGSRHEEVGMTASDDTLFRSKLYHAGSAEELAGTSSTDNRPVTTLDTGGAREMQIKTSEENMQALAEHVYGFFSGHLRFPSGTEFDDLAQQLNLRDSWGQQFDYQESDDSHATMSFTTPWSYTSTIRLALKDEIDDPGAAAMAAVSGTSVSGTTVSGTTVSGSTVASGLNPTSTIPLANRY